MCEKAPTKLGNCSLAGGICLAGDPIDPLIAPGFAPPAGRSVSSVGDCCYLCDQYPTCTNFTYRSDTGKCNLFTSGKGVTLNESCISGGSAGHVWPLPCRDDKDCSGHGTCNGGACNCTGGFTTATDATSASCAVAPASSGSCKIQPGVCLGPGKGPLFKNSTGCTDTCKVASTMLLPSVEDCCFECSVYPKNMGGSGLGCQSFTYSTSNKTCTLLSGTFAEATKTWDPTLDCVSGGALAAVPNTLPGLGDLKSGVCLDGATIATKHAASLSQCEADCAGLAACANWTYHLNKSTCNLEGPGAAKSADPGCVSGGAPAGGMLACRDSKNAGQENFADCSGQGACVNGTCACKGGFLGANCEVTPASMGNCTIHTGVCYDKSSPSKGPYGMQNATSVGDCCYRCDSLQTCTNFVYNVTSKLCVLLEAAPDATATTVGDPTCISGDATEHVILPCRSADDCNGQGTCASGVCTCNKGFNGPKCEFVDKLEGNCTVTESLCVTGTKLFTNDLVVEGPDDCCYECSKHAGECLSFQYNATTKGCTLFADAAAPVAPDPTTGAGGLNDACISGVAAPVMPSMCTAGNLKAGTKLSGGELGSATSKSSLPDCCALCEKTPMCAQFTFDQSDQSCTLHESSATSAPSDSCISGLSNDAALPCRDGKGKEDCNGQGTCNNGTCTCSTGAPQPPLCAPCLGSQCDDAVDHPFWGSIEQLVGPARSLLARPIVR